MSAARSVVSRMLLTASVLLGACLSAQAETPAQAESCAASADGAAATRGPGVAVAIGGALKYDNNTVWRRLVDLAGGDGARFAVFGTASGNPNKASQLIIDALKYHGARAEHIPVAQRLKDSDFRAAANDPLLVAKVRASQGVYFSGGSQERIIEALYDAEGEPTPVLEAIWQVYCSGGVVAGSSAGAAIMSKTMFRDARDVLSVMKFGVARGKEIDRGLGFLGPDVFIDQHFLKRGRFGRMLRVMVEEGYKLGVGVDENTAAIFQGETVEVIGYKGVLVADLNEATTDPNLADFNLRNARLTYLDQGDSYNLHTRVTTPSPQKLRDMKVDPNAPDFKPYFEHQPFYADVLSDTTLVNLMANLIDNKNNEAVGLAFGPPDSKRAELGFEFRFRKTFDSLGYYTGAFGGEDYTVMNILLGHHPGHAGPADVPPDRLEVALAAARGPPTKPMLRDYLPSLLEGLGLTLGVALLSLALAVLLGLAGAAAKLSRSPIWRRLATAYTTVIRGVPDLVLMLLIFYGGQTMANAVAEQLGCEGCVDIDPFTAGVATLGVIFGGYLTETFRGAMLAIPAGQGEAGRAFGLTAWQVFRRITWPQLVRLALPGFSNNWLVLVKSTALVSVIGLNDLMNKAGQAAGATREPFTFYLAVGALYLLITSVSMLVLRALEKRYELGFRVAR